MKSNYLARQVIVYSSLMILAIVLHLVMLMQYGDRDDSTILVGCYLFNWLCTLAFFAIVRFGSPKMKSQLGYVFLYVSVAKFGLFLLIIRPFLDYTDGLRSPEFFYFFVPYAISMVYETRSTVRLLNAK